MAGAGGGRVSQVFLSYAHVDAPAMATVRAALHRSGLAVWTDEHLVPGTPAWTAEIQAAIERATALVVLLTPAAKDSPWVNREIEYAEVRGTPILPVLAAGSVGDAVPITLIRAQHVDLRHTGALDLLVAMLAPVAPTATYAPVTPIVPQEPLQLPVPLPPVYDAPHVVGGGNVGRYVLDRLQQLQPRRNLHVAPELGPQRIQKAMELHTMALPRLGAEGEAFLGIIDTRRHNWVFTDRRLAIHAEVFSSLTVPWADLGRMSIEPADSDQLQRPWLSIRLSQPSSSQFHFMGIYKKFWWPEGGCPSKEELQGLLEAVAAFVRG